MLDKKIVERQIRKVFIGRKDWKVVDNPDWFVWLFSTFFDKYKQAFGKEHTQLKNSTVERIMLCLDDKASRYDLYDNEAWEEIIDQYFSTPFQCNYQLSHFVSGRIILLRMYELGYGDYSIDLEEQGLEVF